MLFWIKSKSIFDYFSFLWFEKIRFWLSFCKIVLFFFLNLAACLSNDFRDSSSTARFKFQLVMEFISESKSTLNTTQFQFSFFCKILTIVTNKSRIRIVIIELHKLNFTVKHILTNFFFRNVYFKFPIDFKALEN